MQMLNELIQNKILFIAVIVALVATIAFIGYLIYREKKREQKEIDEIISNLVEPKRRPVVEEVEEDKEEMKVVESEVVKEESVQPKVDEPIDIEAMLEKMQEDLNAKPQDVVATFEKEQEENSIISYQELISSIKGEKVVPSKVEVKPTKKEIVQVKTEGQPEQLSMDAIIDEKQEKRFKTTEFISPVYGKMEEHLEYPTVPHFHKNDKEIENELETYESNSDGGLINKNIDDFLGEFEFDNNIEVDSLEQTLNMKPLSEEVKKNDDFLQALKDFRKNLD